MVAVALQRLTKVGLHWVPEDRPRRFEADTEELARDKAAQWGDEWVAEDRPNRQYRIDVP